MGRSLRTDMGPIELGEGGRGSWGCVPSRGVVEGGSPRQSTWKNPTAGCDWIASISPKNRAREVAPPSVTSNTECSDVGEVLTQARSSADHES